MTSLLHRAATADRLATASAERLAERVRGLVAAGQTMGSGEQEAIFGDVLGDLLAEESMRLMRADEPALSEHDEWELRQAVHDIVFGYAGLQPLLDEPGVTNVICNGCDETWLVYADGRKVAGQPVAGSDEELISLVRRIGTWGAELGTRRFDANHPMMDAVLPDGSRLNAIGWVVDRPHVTIRRHTLLDVRWQHAARHGMVSPEAQAFLGAAARARLQIVVSGPTGVGKTTFMRAIADCFDPAERIVTIESDRELRLPADRHHDVVAIQAREANTEGVGEVTMAALVHNALRMSPDRIIVGEVRGPETLAMLWSLTSGHQGSLTSIHADSPRGVFDMIVLHGLRAVPATPPEASLRLASAGIDLVVHMDRAKAGAVGHVTSIHHVAGYDGHLVHTNEVFAEGPHGLAIPAMAVPHELRDRLAEHGYDVDGLGRGFKPSIVRGIE